MQYSEWMHDSEAKRKTLIFLGSVGAAVLLLLHPWSAVHISTAAEGRKPGTEGHGPSPPPKPPVSAPVAVTPPVVPAPAVDPMNAVLGKFGGEMALPTRGACNIALEIDSGEKPGEYHGSSRLQCMPNMMELLAQAKQKNPAGVMATVTKINPTAATFKGTAQDGAVVLVATDNFGVGETYHGCAMEKITVRTFSEKDKQVSVRWQEKDSGDSPWCTGGEMILGRR